jgi:nucleotide-binding universal stress UspA family protein
MIVVGVEESERSADAVALARRLADATGGELLLVNAYPYEEVPGGPSRPEYEEYVSRSSRELLEAARAALAPMPVGTASVAGFSAARVLHEAAERTGAALIVVGPTHHPTDGSATAAVPDRLLSGAPAPVAQAPLGYAGREAAGFTRVGVAFTDNEAGREALLVAGRLARSAGAALRVASVADPRLWRLDARAGRAGEEELRTAHLEVLETRARAALASLADGLDVEVSVLEGDPVRELVLLSQQLDLLVCGSRAYGPATAVLAGGTSRALMHRAACPVLVVPRTGAVAAWEVAFADELRGSGP